MRHSSLRALTITLALVLTALGAGTIPAVRAADCGTGVGPCHCGDRVVTHTKLGGSDPVLRAICPCEGLIVASGVTLEIRGTLTGEGDTCSGILLEGNATGVVVTNGTLRGFNVGVNGDSLGSVSGNRFANLRIFGGFAGLLLTGDANVVESTVVRDAFVAGVLLTGDGNTVRLNRAEGVALFGLAVIGNANAISRNVAQGNDGVGFALAGDGVTVEGTRAAYNGGAGFVLDGTGLTVSRNVAARNALEGFAVSASASSFARNRSDHNGFFGIDDIGTDNAYEGNRCTGNGDGPSNPPGLCR